MPRIDKKEYDSCFHDNFITGQCHIHIYFINSTFIWQIHLWYWLRIPQFNLFLYEQQDLERLLFLYYCNKASVLMFYDSVFE